MVRNFGKKMQTIFKKGLSLSIAMALGVAATSVNLAKTAEAAPITEGTVRKVYLAGEKLSAEGLAGGPASHFKIGAAADVVANLPVVTQSGTVTFQDDEPGTNTLEVPYTVYDWANVYKGTSVTAAHNAAHDTVRNAIVDELSLAASYHVFRTYLKTCELQLADGGKKIDTVSYASHNDKDVQLKSPNGDFVYKLGKLQVEREISQVDLESAPAKLGYSLDDKVDFSGLKVKVTYTNKDTEIVEYKEDNKKLFAFIDADSNAITADTKVKKNIEGIRVSYNNVAVNDVESNKFNFYLCNKNQTLTFGNVSVQGNFVDGTSLSVQELADSTETYQKLAAQAGSAKILGAFNFQIKPLAWSGDALLGFYVGEDRAGQTVTIIDMHADGTFGSKTVTVAKNGYAFLTHAPYGAFMIVEGAVAAGGAASEAGKDAGSKSEETSKDAGSKSEGGSSKSGGSVKTGDNSVVAMSALALVALLSYVALFLLKKKDIKA